MSDQDDQEEWLEALADLAREATIEREIVEGCAAISPRHIRLLRLDERLGYEMAGKREIEYISLVVIVCCQRQNLDGWTRVSERQLSEAAELSRTPVRWIDLLVEDGMVLCVTPDAPCSERVYAVTSRFVEFWARVYPT